MVKILSLLKSKNDDILENHQHYCHAHNYQHMWVTTDFLQHPKLRVAYKYNFLLEQLKRLDEGDLVMLLDGHSVVWKPLDLEALMVDRDSLVLNGPTEPNGTQLVMSNMLIVRNTASIRSILFDILMALHGTLAGQEQPEEEILLQKFSVLYTNGTFENTYININWRVPEWFRHQIFVVFLGANAISNLDGTIDRDAPSQLTHDNNFERFLVRQINAALKHGAPVLQLPNYPAISNDAVSHFNPNSKIALVTLYTHHINTYARVSEHNVKRYCDRHGYAYHVYRAIPSELDPNINGAWVKNWLLKKHLADHEWVIWVDADALFRNQSIKLESILDQRDLLFAKDLCAWPINAGIMGFRNTPENFELIERIWQRMIDVNDKSTVYSNQGDQYHSILELQESGLINEKNIVSCLTINTPPPLSSPDNLLIHYMGLSEPYRSVYMAHHDTKLSQSS